MLSCLCALLLVQATAQDRAPEPDAAQQKETLKKIRDLFREDYAKKLPAEQQALAHKLFQNGTETADDLPARYMLLREARDLATQLGDVDTAARAVDELAKTFAVDGPALKLAVLGKIAVKEPDAARSAARACLALIPDAVRAENFETATAAVARAEAFAKAAQDVALASKVAETKAEVGSLKAEAARVKPLLEKPGEGDAEAIGRYLCFVKGDWDAGIPHLIAGAKGPVKAAAEKEALKPQDPVAQLDLADAWWEVAAKEKSPWRRERIQGRVRTWIDLAAPSATGLLKVRSQKRLEELESLQPGYVNLLRLVDPARDAVTGSWKLDDGKLVCSEASPAKLEIPYQPPAEYDFRMTYSLLGGGHNVTQYLSRQGKQFTWVLELGLNRCAFAMCRGCFITDAKNPSLTELANPGPGPHVSLIEVRKDRVRAHFNGKLVCEWKTDYADLGLLANWKLKTEQSLGLGSWGCPTAFHRLELTEISGKGKKLH